MRFGQLLFSVYLLGFSIDATAEAVRCAFDVGSGGLRVAASPAGFMKPRSIELAIKKSVQDGVLSEAMVAEITRHLLDLKSDCDKIEAKEFVGVATSGFRAANVNGATAAAKISGDTGIRLRVIDGSTEGVLGFYAATARLGTHAPKNLGVWDIGGGSMQVSVGTFKDGRWTAIQSESIPVGVGSFVEDILPAALKKTRGNLLPFSRADSARAKKAGERVLANLPTTLKSRLKRKPRSFWVGIGGVHSDLGSEVAKRAKLEPGMPVSKLTFERALKDSVGFDLDRFKAEYPTNRYPHSIAANLALIAGGMAALRTDEITPIDVNLADGLLAHPDEWKIK